MSIYASAKLYCTTEETTSGFDYLRETCELSGIEMMSLDNITATATDSYVRSLQVIDPSILSPGMAITQAVVLSPSYYVLALRTLKDDEEIVPVDSHFGYALSGFWAIVLVIGMMNKLWNVVFKHRFANAKSTFPLLATAHHLYRTHLQLPATFGSHHQRLLFWCTIPTRLESFVIFSWWAINIILNCPRIDAFVGSTDGGTVSMQVWEYVGYRSGWLAIATLPWIWMFAGRNNIFIWVTGWSFGTFNIFHRHVARAATLQAIVHGISYTVLYVEADYYTYYMATNWFRSGIVALVAMSLLLLLSSSWLRRKWYEVFLFGHISLSIVVIYALFRHTVPIYETYFNPYLWTPIAIWSFDRFLRIVRMAYCNYHVRFSGSAIASTTTTISYQKESKVLRIELQPGSETLRPGPGQHYFLYQPYSISGWESHPFTLAAYSAPSQSGAPQIENNDKTFEVNTSSAVAGSDFDTSISKNKLVFWIRPYDGWTKRIRNQCLKSSTGIIQPTILLEGPYGHSASVHAYDTILMITAGTGIAAAVPYILDHIKRSSTGNTRCTDMRLHWTARQPDFLRDVCGQELAPALERSDFSASLYCTSSNVVLSPAASDVSPIEQKPDFLSLPSRSDIQIQDGRPDVTALILDAAEEAVTASVRLAVLVCGPAVIADEARAAVVAAMKRGCRRIEYFEEAYGW